MKLLLINPPWTYPKKYFKRSDLSVSIPLGLLYLASMIEKHMKKSVQIKILDSFTLEKNIVHETDSMFHLGARFNKLSKEIEKFKPDVIGITSPFTSQVNNAIKIVKIAKNLFPNIPVIMGGPHSTIQPIELLKEKVDICVIGEAEDTFLEIIERLKSKKPLLAIPGTAYKNKITPKKEFIDNLDEIPFPAYHLINMKRYFQLFELGFSNRPYNASHRTLPIITSRGCPFNCCFCSIHLHMGRKWRAHSSKYVIKHIKHMVKKYNVKHISFEDDNLTLDTKRFEEILNGLIKNNIKITWDTPNGVRADKLTKKILIKAKQTGCKALVIGIESGVKRILDKVINKSLDLNKVIKISKSAKEVGLLVSAFFMIGIPGETKKDIKNTLKFAIMLNKKYDVMPSVTFAAPLIGTPMYDQALKKGYLTKKITPKTLLVASHTTGKGLLKTKEFTPEFLKSEIEKFYSKLTRQQLMKPTYLIKRFIDNPKMFFRLGWILIKKQIKGKQNPYS
jgi:anaerobic magnesium-protoporphyrin IX monomethyl ester cyclase